MCVALIAQFTGMRINEVASTPLNGWAVKTISGQKVYGVNSYTSKLNKGVNKPELWVTSQKVEPAFHLAQRLAKIVYQHKHLIELPPKKSAWNKLPLFPQATAFKEQKSSIFDYTKSSLEDVRVKLREWSSQTKHDLVFVNYK